MPAQPTVAQPAGTIALGPNAQATVNVAGATVVGGLIFAVVSGTYREQGDRADTTDTKAVQGFAPGLLPMGLKDNKIGLGQISADLELQQDPTISIHQGIGASAVLLGLRVRGVVALTIFPYGIAIPTGYYIPFFTVIECDGDFRVQGSEPQHMRIRGESNGSYLMLGDSQFQN